MTQQSQSQPQLVQIYTDRSRIETKQHCARERYLRYHAEGTGLAPARNSLALVFGGAVHEGLRPVLEAFRDENLVTDFLAGNAAARVEALEELAVKVALKFFTDQFGAGLEVEGVERQSLHDAAKQPLPDMTATLEASFGASYDKCLQCGNIEAPDKHAQIGTDPLLPVGDRAPYTACSQCFGASFQTIGDGQHDPAGLDDRTQTVVTRFDRYLRAEQTALVEAMIRAYIRRRLRPLLEEFQILEVEREGVWTLANVERADLKPTDRLPLHAEAEILFQSRPDALLLHRASRQLQILSFKTAGSLDARRMKDAERDMQGLSEGIEVEMRLANYWKQVHDGRWAGEKYSVMAERLGTTLNVLMFIANCPEPPTIHAIRYEFLLKGERWEDKKLSAEYGFKARHQRSPLVRRYVAHSTPSRGKNAAAFDVGDICVEWDFIQADGALSKLSASNWSSVAVWEETTIKKWIDLLDEASLVMSDGDPTMGTEPSARGWGGRFQKMGYLPNHPLDAAFIPPVTVYRNDDDLRDMIEQIEHQEVRVAQGLAAVNDTTDEGERRSLLNQHFPQTRRACSYPTDCAMIPICYGSDDIRTLPLESGKYIRRKPHHEAERVQFEQAQAQVQSGVATPSAQGGGA